MQFSNAPFSAVTSPSPEPRKWPNIMPGDPPAYMINLGGQTFAPMVDAQVALWVSRQQVWRNGFEQEIGPKAREFHSLYRCFDVWPIVGPDTDWRDRTVNPEAFKIIENLVARDVLAQFGNREWFGVETEKGDSSYEETVRKVLMRAFDLIGTDGHEGGFYQRMIDAARYKYIMGHVWILPFWKKTLVPIKTKVPTGTANGKKSYQMVEQLATTYDGVDITWVGVGDIAFDLGSRNRRWLIHRVKTSLEALKAEDENFYQQYGQRLYSNLDIAALFSNKSSASPVKESFEEPDNTENWPLDSSEVTGDMNNTDVEMWLCWDNQARTLTKILNRRVIIAHSYAPTKDGLDPFISAPCLPVPNRPYGESPLWYVRDQLKAATKLDRARLDEVILGIWQQYVARENSVVSDRHFNVPGGILFLQNSPDPTRRIDTDIQVLQRRPVMPEAYNEVSYRQQSTESTLGVDQLIQGSQATDKSRDVSAAEINTRAQMGDARRQVDVIYNEETLKRPLLRKAFELIQMHQEEPVTVRLDDGTEKVVDLTDLAVGVNFSIGSGLREKTLEEKATETAEILAYTANPLIAPVLKVPQIMRRHLRNRGEKRVNEFIKTDEELAQEQAAAMAAQAAQAGAPGQPPPMGVPSPAPPPPEPPSPEVEEF